MRTTLKLTLLALAFAATSAFAQDKPAKMKATKDCGTCCTQGGDCCDKCSPTKCAPCCDKKKEAPKQQSAALRQNPSRPFTAQASACAVQHEQLNPQKERQSYED